MCRCVTPTLERFSWPTPGRDLSGVRPAACCPTGVERSEGR